MPQPITIEDYLFEIDRITGIIGKTKSKKGKRNWRKYRYRLHKQIADFDKYKGTNYAASIIF